MQMPVNSSLQIVFYNRASGATPTLTVATRLRGGPLQVSTKTFPLLSTDGVSVQTVPILADELIYYSLVAGQPGTDGGVSALVNLQFQSGTSNEQTHMLSWGMLYERPVHAWQDEQLYRGDDIQARPFSIHEADPAAGADFALSLADVAWSVEAFHAILTTDVNVANRIPFLEWSDQNGRIANQIYTPTAVTALTAARLNWSMIGSSSTPAVSRQSLPLSKLIMDPGYTLSLQSVSKQAADQISDVQIMMRIWPVIAPI